MSTMIFTNDILNSVSMTNLKPVLASGIEQKLTKIETEWSAGTNTDFKINTGKVINLNTGMLDANTIGTAGNTSIYGEVKHVSGLNFPFAKIEYATVSAVDAGSTVIPLDDTIPQINEGDEYLTLAFTPESVTSTLIVEVDLHLSHSAGGTMAAALFQNSDANALTVTSRILAGAALVSHLKLTYTFIPGSVTPITFSVRAGCSAAGTTTLNGVSSGRLFGGVLNSLITVRELRA